MAPASLASLIIIPVTPTIDGFAERVSALQARGFGVFFPDNLTPQKDLGKPVPDTHPNSIYHYFAQDCLNEYERVFVVCATDQDHERAVHEAALGLMDNPHFRWPD